MGLFGGNDMKTEVKKVEKGIKRVERDEKEFDKMLKDFLEMKNKLLEMKNELNNERIELKVELNKLYGKINDTSKKTNHVELSGIANKLKKVFKNVVKVEGRLAKFEAAIINDEERASARIKIRNVEYIKGTILVQLEAFISMTPIQHENNQDIANEIEQERRHLGEIVSEYIKMSEMEDGKITNNEFSQFVDRQRSGL